jgi:dTDP-glucose 4,6-dehydratase
MNRILLTGGAGFIGAHLVHHLLKEAVPPPARLVVLDALSYAGDRDALRDCEADPRFTFVHGSILDAALVSRLLQEHAITDVMHLAAESHVDRSIDSALPFVETNVLGTQVLLDAFRRHRSAQPPEIQASMRFLHVSTDEVFGSLAPEDPPFCETTPYAPRSPYAASKAASDHLARAAHDTHGLPIIVTHCTNNYGPRQLPEKLIPLTLLNAFEGRPVPIYGDGLQVRDWLHVRDHCRALETVLRRGRPGETYGIGGRCERTNLALLETLLGLLDEMYPDPTGASYRRLQTFVPDRPGHDRRYAMNIEKIQTELGWSPQVSLESGLRETIAWYWENRAWCASRGLHRQRLGLGR